MRTEQQLRDAFAALADQPPAIDAVFDQIMARTAPTATSTRRRRTVFVLAAVLAVLVAIAVPAVLVNRSAVPADTRAPGNWNLTHRVDLPAGWALTTAQIRGDTESSAMQTPAGTEAPEQQCELTVKGPGAFRPGSAARTLEVEGQPAYYEDASFDSVGGVFWPYAEDSWAIMSCNLGLGDPQDAGSRAEVKALSLELARRVVFTPTPVRLPFRLTEAPTGYRPEIVAVGQSPTGDPASSVQLSAGATSQPPVGVVVTRGATEVPAGIPGWERDTIDGLPAVLSARDGRLCLNPPGHSVCVVAEGGDPADLTTSLWPAGRRELLVEVARHLTLARDLDDQSTWWDANRALPR